MRKAALLVVTFLTLLLAPLAVRYFQQYRPLAAAPATPPAYTAAGIAAVPTPAAGDFSDEPDISRVATDTPAASLSSTRPTATSSPARSWPRSMACWRRAGWSCAR
jgi:hypothetical protein